MTRKLKQGFFKVTPMKPYVPLTALHYGYEADNVFQIRKQGGSVVATYQAMSHGMGKVLSLFNTEFFVFHNGATQIKCVSPSGQEKVLLNLTSVDDASVITMDNNFVVVSRVQDIYTVKSYVIAGTTQDFWAELVDTKTISAPTGYTNISVKLGGCRANDTDIYAVNVIVTGPAFKTLKIVTNNGFSPDATLSWEDGALTDMSLPVAGTLLRTVQGRTFYSCLYNFYVIKNGTDYTIYNKGGTQIWTGTIAGDAVSFALDNNTGNGYIVSAIARNVSGSRFLVILYSLQNGVLTQVASAASGDQRQSPYFDGLYPLVDSTIAPMIQPAYPAEALGYKSVATTSSISVQNSNSVLSGFGSWVRFA